jgi:hypothetical protein
MRRQLSSRRGRGNVGIPKGFPKSVERVGSRLHGFPCFPYSVISMARFSPCRCWIKRYAAAQCNVPHSRRDVHRYSALVISICLCADRQNRRSVSLPLVHNDWVTGERVFGGLCFRSTCSLQQFAKRAYYPSMRLGCAAPGPSALR